MRVVVLYLHQRSITMVLHGPSAREVTGVSVGCDHGRLHGIHPLESVDGSLERAQRLNAHAVHQPTVAIDNLGVPRIVKHIAAASQCQLHRGKIVCPGFVETDMLQSSGVADLGEKAFRRLPIQRFGTVDDIANMVLFLASDASSYCTGQEFTVDGGMVP